jgi:protein phosphatase
MSSLKGLLSSGEEPPREEVLPTWDVPVALPVAEPIESAPGAIPLALPVSPSSITDPEIPLALVPEALPHPVPPTAPEMDLQAPAAPALPAPATIRCPVCSRDNPSAEAYCSECGYHFSSADLMAAAAQTEGAAAPGPAAGETPLPAGRIQGRYELKALLAERGPVQRYRALDFGPEGDGPGVPVTVIRGPLPGPAQALPVAEALPATEPLPEAAPVEESNAEEILPSFDDPTPSGFPVTDVLCQEPGWPSISWERRLLHTMEEPALPAELAYFSDDTHEYLVEEVSSGVPLWDAWDDPAAAGYQKYGYLVEVAETLNRLHRSNAMLEGLRPDILVVGDDGHVHFTDLADLLPLPLPYGASVRGSLYTAPELASGQGNADSRADLYSFGAMLYALSVGRELNEKTDFDGPGNPKPYIPRFPDTHPAFGRLMMKTFRKEVEARFPTDEAGKEDATGFTELIRTLEVLRRTSDNARLEIACWTSTGIVRTGNEDAFALMHACESRQDDLGEAALVLLCDGMGGYEAGEVAAALTIQVLRQQLANLRPFSSAAGASPFPTDPLTHMSKPEGHAGAPLNVETARAAIKAALREANKQVFQASRAPGSKRRGMGCTAEVVFVDGRNVVVGHVGDSRTYHLHEGRMIQMTRDQTLVNRLVELGSLTAAEAETHPRRNELQQAIGGQPDVEPGLYHGRLLPGDWVVVCSDGLTNHVSARDLQQMLQSEATSAEMAARRLVNLTLIEGATDNVTVVVIRAT